MDEKSKKTDGNDITGSGLALNSLYGNMASKYAMVTFIDENPGIAGSGGVEDGSYYIIRSIMRLLQLLVEGHNYRMQEYMREQPDNIKNFDLVKNGKKA